MALSLTLQEADLVVSTLFINKDRLEYVDMTKPYLDVGLGVLITKEASGRGLFALFEPFEYSLWGTIVVLTWLFGILVTLCSYFSPYGYRGRYIQRLRKKDSTYKDLQDELSYHHGVWFSVSSIMWQVMQHQRL